VLLSGDFIPLDTLQRLRRHGCSAELVSLGGATEASIWSVFHRVQQVNPAWRSIPYGRPLPNQTMQVLDAALRPTPDHVRGRIYIGGAGLAQGYLREPVLTAERFFHHPATGQRLYDTGDLGLYAADGSIVILGRDDRQVKIRGHRVELGEVEAVLARHPDVAQAVVTAPAAPGGGPRRLVAHLQPRPGCVLQEAALRQHAATHLPEHMVPLHIVVLERLPLSANGKLDLRALPDPAEGITDTPPRQPARNDTERTLLAIWQRAMPGIEIGVTDSFFELGGDSVLAAHLLRELNAELPVKLQMHELFEHMSIEALALWADAQAAQPA
jgi:acyl-coenzyme A synthetase/AMP-(fatty) acid ligase